MGAALGVAVVVEGVETQATWDWLEGENCQFVQGHYVSRPQPLDQFENWLQAGPWRPQMVVDTAEPAWVDGAG
jgi:EAL domain-containing protein (putative c-di-GMP-specific phosphodiesterase class I)